ncbi:MULTISPECIES: murein transglycosylase A [Moorena]|uniref:peptidoglycan lytic exotransglycosylase n=1 Tax=Moorena producens 3L TaxID=489825 RepID=F4XTV2_9CYAN|nr:MULTISPECIES: murein transglycosylase A [Moorena]EGJ31928.1 membrane-bound lytic murein transglycosylase [Moorena producens 3L]NEP31655.1 murein transglycosylase A [Moorena sp. SIO3B2]NEP64312.1 murein transglycosylase A [Moorena sp. SIO3A5]NER89180.1 murein transglycosylase A [Moorena sp. SIO3A2]OLT67189.1 murein transglycosylase [Moorena producens 3L]
MRKTLTRISLTIGIAILPISGAAVASVPLQAVQLETVQFNQDPLGLDEQLWKRPGGKSGDWRAMLRAIDNSLRYLKTPSAAKAYQNYSVPGVTRDRVRRSLVRFRQLLIKSPTPKALQAAIQQEFVFYKSLGKDNQGTVGFTGYFEPVYAGSRTPSAEYRYPLYRLPSDFQRWQKPHPTRAALEGWDGLGKNSPLRGKELVWLRDRLEAFLVHVQGSARVRMPDGTLMSVGYAGKTSHPYTSIGGQLVNDGKMELEGLTLPAVIDYFRTSPTELSQYLPRNKSFVFFRETRGAPATGSLGLPVMAERSIATDKSIMPPGALALIQTSIPYPNAVGQLESRLVSRYVLDQDTGSAIKGPGRVDIFMGTGKLAGNRAGLINDTGELYYLLLKN